MRRATMEAGIQLLLSAGELFPQLWFHPNLRVFWHIHIFCRRRVRQI